jgi:SPP1 family phage portal protein
MLTTQEIKDQILEHSPERAHALENRNLYRGLLPIYHDKKHDNKNKIGTRFHANFVDKFVGYFAGKPTTIQHTTSEDIQDVWDDITFDNDLPYIQRLLTHEAALTGAGYLMMYQNEAGENKWLILKRENIIMVRNETTEELEHVIRYYHLKEGQTNRLVAEVYDREGNIYYYIETKQGLVMDYSRKDNPAKHHFRTIPIFEFALNREKIALIDGIKDIARVFDSIISNAADENEDIRNVYAFLTTNMALPEGSLQTMLGSRIIEMDQGSTFEFKSKDAKTESMERFLDRLTKLMYEMAQIVDMSDDSFASAQSGVALILKTFNMNNRAVIVEDEFKRAYRQILKAIEPIIAATLMDPSILDIEGREPIYKVREWDIQFQRNMPLSMVQTTQDLTNLKNLDIIDDETLLSLMDFVNDPMAIINKKEIQDKERMGIDYPEIHEEE